MLARCIYRNIMAHQNVNAYEEKNTILKPAIKKSLNQFQKFISVKATVKSGFHPSKLKWHSPVWLAYHKRCFSWHTSMCSVLLRKCKLQFFLQVVLRTLQVDCRGPAFCSHLCEVKLAWQRIIVTWTQTANKCTGITLGSSPYLHCWSEQSRGCFGHINRGQDVLAGVA